MQRSLRLLARAATTLLLLLSTRPLAAQEIRGVVRDAVTGQPIAGAVLQLLDSANVSHARNITDPRGEYRIATSSWMKRLRVLRIGFRPTEIALPPSSPTVVQLDVTMTQVPTMLEPIQVKGQTLCSARRDRIAALSLLEQARAGLLAAIVAQETTPATMIRLRTATKIDADTVSSLRVGFDSSYGSQRAFQAVRPAGDFVKLGFFDDRRETMYAPDAETLLNDDFRDGYCFQLRDREKTRPTAVGLGFTPAKRQRGRIDVDGTLWIDTLSRRLLDIRYEYVGMPSELETAEPGGVVRFRSLDNGVVLIDEWDLRLPRIDADTARDASTNEDLGQSATIRRADRFGRPPSKAQTSGGYVARVEWPDGFAWDAPLATARITLVDAAKQPLSNHAVVLEGTQYEGVTDVNGVVVIRRLVPGPYVAGIKDSTLERIGLPIQTSLKFAVTDTDTFTATVVAPSARDYIASRCQALGTKSPDWTSPWLAARIMDASGAAVPNAEWRAWRLQQTAKDPTGVWSSVADVGRTSSDGLAIFCSHGFQKNDRVRITIKADRNGPAEQAELVLTDGMLTAVGLRLEPIRNP